jgi:hypothetical protein
VAACKGERAQRVSVYAGLLVRQAHQNLLLSARQVPFLCYMYFFLSTVEGLLFFFCLIAYPTVESKKTRRDKKTSVEQEKQEEEEGGNEQ